jgi:hypothetical protein
LTLYSLFHPQFELATAKYEKLKLPIDETGYQFTKFACFDSDKDLILVKSMSCSGGMVKANSKLGLKPVLFSS